MSYSDLYLIETGNGGDLVVVGNDMKIIDGLENFIYIGLFGGNPGHSTQGAKVDEQIFDFWGNYLFEPSNRSIWFNSTFEYLLRNLAITTANRIVLEQAILEDLQFMTSFATIQPTVQIVGFDKLKITILVTKINGTLSRELVFLWDATLLELENMPQYNSIGNGVALNLPLNFEI